MQCSILKVLPGKSINSLEVYKCECGCNLSIDSCEEIWENPPAFKIAEFGSNKYVLGSEYVAVLSSLKMKSNFCLSVLVFGCLDLLDYYSRTPGSFCL